eukprot:SAG31_NODE_3190_length_4571_cov_3.184481_5_plen_356_part_00
MRAEDLKLQQHALAQARGATHADRPPPKHTLAAAAAAGSRQERAQDGVMAQLLAKGEDTTTAAAGGATYQEEHTCHLYGVDEVMSAYQKTIRRNEVEDAMWWAAELETSGLGRMAMSRLTVMAVEDVCTGAPLLPLYIACAWRSYMQLQDPQSGVYDLAAARRKLLEAAAVVSAAPGNRMSCFAGKAGAIALKAALAARNATQALPNSSPELTQLVHGLDERPTALMKQATVAMQRARQGRDGESVAWAEIVALSRFKAVELLRPGGDGSDLRWQVLRRAPVTHRCTAQAIEACYSLCHGGGCSAADLCLYTAFSLVTRERWLEVGQKKVEPPQLPCSSISFFLLFLSFYPDRKI